MSHSTLEHLAWSMLPEKAIAMKLAYKCVLRRLTWTRGDKGKIRDVVNRAPAIRGDKKRRLEAVLHWLPKIHGIRNTRKQNVPIDWTSWKAPHINNRRNAIANRYVHESGWSSHDCRVLRRWRGHLLMVKGSYLYILHPNLSMSRVMIVKDHGASLTARIIRLHRVKVELAIAEGKRFTFDFCRMTTTIYHHDGSREILLWSKPSGNSVR